MSYFRDLTPYVYQPTGAAMLNVGWLEAGEPFSVGDVDPLVRDLLVEAARAHTNVTRGFHDCGLCDLESPVEVHRTDRPDRSALLGFGEIHVTHAGTTYAAPTLIVHYIDAHRYAPPSEFLDAVRAAAHPD